MRARVLSTDLVCFNSVHGIAARPREAWGGMGRHVVTLKLERTASIEVAGSPKAYIMIMFGPFILYL